MIHTNPEKRIKTQKHTIPTNKKNAYICIYAGKRAKTHTTATIRSSKFQGTKRFYALERKYLRANIESITENDVGILNKCLTGGYCFTGGFLGAGFHCT